MKKYCKIHIKLKTATLLTRMLNKAHNQNYFKKSPLPKPLNKRRSEKNDYFAKDVMLTRKQDNTVYTTNYSGSVAQNEYLLNKLQNQQRIENEILSKKTLIG